MEPLDDVYAYAGLRQAFPQGLIDLATFEDHEWAIPLSVARSNVLWYSRSILNRNDIQPQDLQTFSGWEAAAKKLQAAGITPLAFGNAEPWVSWQLFEAVLVGTLGPEKYAGLWGGTTDWRGPEVAQALQNFRMMLGYTNPNHARIQWDQGYALLVQHQAAMYIMGDWMLREFSNNAFGDYGWTTAPGTAGSFILWPDSFSLPHGTQHPEVAGNSWRFSPRATHSNTSTEIAARGPCAPEPTATTLDSAPTTGPLPPTCGGTASFLRLRAPWPIQNLGLPTSRLPSRIFCSPTIWPRLNQIWIQPAAPQRSATRPCPRSRQPISTAAGPQSMGSGSGVC